MVTGSVAGRRVVVHGTLALPDVGPTVTRTVGKTVAVLVLRGTQTDGPHPHPVIKPPTHGDSSKEGVTILFTRSGGRDPTCL